MNNSTSYYGAVVIVGVSYADGDGTKIRPALVISKDDFMHLKRVRRVILAPITKNIRGHLSPLDVLIEKNTQAYKCSGLKRTSCVRLDKMYNFEFDYITQQREIKPKENIRIIGKMPDSFMKGIGELCRSIF